MTEAAYQTACGSCDNTHSAAASYCPWCGSAVDGDITGVTGRDIVAYHLRHALEHASDARARVSIRRALQWVIVVDREEPDT